MKKNSNGETIVSILIIIIIISIVLIGMIKIIDYDSELNFQYDKINYISLLEKNTNVIVNKIDTFDLSEGEIFFLYKTGSEIQVLSGSVNQDYRYINYLGEHVNTGSYQGHIYTRQCGVEKTSNEGQMIKCSIKELIKK